MRRIPFLFLVLLFATTEAWAQAPATLNGFAGAGTAAATASTKAPPAPRAINLPLFFEANQGQRDPRVRFLTRSSGYTLFLTPTETVFAEAKTEITTEAGKFGGLQRLKSSSGALVRMQLLGANSEPAMSGLEELPGKVNYLIGSDHSQWHSGVPLFSKVRSEQVYPGVDLLFHGDQNQLEYDFIVAPGADPSKIKFRIRGAARMEIDSRGDLVLHTPTSDFRMRKPVIYQTIGSERRAVEGSFVRKGKREVAFRVGAYDRTQPLVIDPTIAYATFLGGGSVDQPFGLAVDSSTPASPKVYVVGGTFDPTTFAEPHSLIGTAGGATYAFIAKIDPTTTGAASLDYLTFIGGHTALPGASSCQSLAGNVSLDFSQGITSIQPVLSGQTSCSDYPGTLIQAFTGSPADFVTRLDSAGTAIDVSVVLGGNGKQEGAFSSVDPSGNVLLSGGTDSTNLPTTAGAYITLFNNGNTGANLGNSDCFVAKLQRSNLMPTYLTYLNVGAGSGIGNNPNVGCGAIEDSSGRINAGGNTTSAVAFNLGPGGASLANGFQTALQGTQDTFLMRLNPALGGTAELDYASYYGGGGTTNATNGALDLGNGVVAIVGLTTSSAANAPPDIPLKNAFQTSNTGLPANGGGTGFLVLIDTTNTGAASLLCSTYFGGSSGSDQIDAVTYDAGDPSSFRIILGGQTRSAADFPTLNPLQTFQGVQDGFVSVLKVPMPGQNFNASLNFSTFIGGGVQSSGQSERITGVGVDAEHTIYATGRTLSANFFTPSGATVNGFQAACKSCGGATPADDAVIFSIKTGANATLQSITVTPASPSIVAGKTQQFAAQGFFSDGTIQNITTTAVWASATPGVATISNSTGSQGLATGVSAGQSSITASLNGVTSPGDILTVTGAANPPVLLISKSHTGNFMQGQQGAIYTVTVSNNANAGPTNGTVTMTETVPPGLTLVSLAGQGWMCGNPNPANVCTRSDSLLGGHPYPFITVTVNVAANATSPQSNQVSASGGGSATINANDPTIITPVFLLKVTETGTGTGAVTSQSGLSPAINCSDAPGGPTSCTASYPSGTQVILAATATTGTFAGWSGGVPACTGTATCTVTMTQAQTVNAAFNIAVGPTLVSIAVTPANLTLPQGITQQYTAIGTFSDNSKQNLTTSVTWASATPGVATISNAATSQGLASTVAAGGTMISATLGTIVGATNLTVSASAQLLVSDWNVSGGGSDDKQRIDGKSPPLQVQLTNTSTTQTVHITGAISDNPSYTVTTNCATLGPGQSCPVFVTLTTTQLCQPKIPHPDVNVTVIDDDPGGSFQFNVNGYGSDSGLAVTDLTSTNLIANGSFETPVVAKGAFSNFGSGSTGITGWKVVGAAGGVSIVSGSFSQNGISFPAEDGAQWVDLTGDGTNGVEGLEQTVPTTSGTQYTLSFWVGNVNNPGGIFGTTSTVKVLLGGLNGTLLGTFTNSSTNTTTQTWQQFTTSFTATGPTTTIDFINADPASDNNNGLDNVVLTVSGQSASSTLSAQQLAQTLVGPGVTISNVTYTGALRAAGTFTSSSNIIGFTGGVILSTGSVRNVVGPNCSQDISVDNGQPGDPDLTKLAGDATNDAAVLQFDFVPTSSSISFQYVFSSDEYNEFVGQKFNDAFGFFLAAVDGTPVNIALIPGTNLPVAINNVNGGNTTVTPPIPPSNPQFFINNDFQVPAAAPVDTEMDGLTVVFTAQAQVIPGDTYHIKLAIADATDSSVDSNVFIKAGSLASTAVTLSPATVAFGAQQVGVQSSSRPVTLANTGTTAVNIASIVPSPPFGETDNCPKQLAPSGQASSSCIINVTITPTSAMMFNGTLTVMDDSPTTGSQQIVTLSGTGTGTAPAALSITKTHTGNFTQGQQNAHYSVSVTNGVSAGSTSGTVTVTDTIPSGLTLVSMAGTGWSCGATPNPANVCTRNDVLSNDSSYPLITVTVNVATNATSPQVNSVTVSGGGSASASASDSTIITPLGAPSLSITKTHQGNFTLGQQGASYTVTVSNAASVAPTTGTVTVADSIPDGLSLVSMTGMGWSCEGSGCSRSDALASGASYPAITVTVNVTATSASTVVNTVTVTGGGSAAASASDSTVISSVPFTLVINPPPGGNPNAPLPVTPGGQVAVGLILTPAPGFSGTVTFSCTTSAPQFLTCAPAPSQVKLTPGGTQVAIVVNTFCQGAAPMNGPANGPIKSPGGFALGVEMLLAALAIAGIAWSYRRRSRWALSFAVLALMALGSAACNSLPKGSAGATPPGNYTLFITARANGQSSTVQQPIQVLP